MKERPIIFSGAMVRAILEGRKTQTRRVVKPQPKVVHAVHADASITTEQLFRSGDGRVHCPYGQPGDRLWVRETHRAEELTAEAAIAAAFLSGDDIPLEGLDGVRYLADDHFEPIENTPEAADAWGDLNAYRGQRGANVPPIHMPRWASRILLEIIDVRVERVQYISEDDALAEGVTGHSWYDHSTLGICTNDGELPSEEFRDLWDSINAKRGFGWAANPWVWALTFKRVEQPR